MHGWLRRLGAIAIMLPVAIPAASAKDEPFKPRFVSLRSERVNMRVGPGRQYPIKWEFNQVGRPVEVIQEYDVWRRVRDIDGTDGWVLQNLLTNKRTVIVTGTAPRTLRKRAGETEDLVARVEPKVVARLMECTPEWCRVEASGVRGWLKRGEIWGLYPGEVID